MHKTRIDKDGVLRCCVCGSSKLLAKSNERGKRTQHLKCEQCGEHQRYREPKRHPKAAPASVGAARASTPIAALSPTPTATPVSVAPTDGGAPTLARIAWRRPE